MSSRTILSRPRTRVYDANYNIGESYYKSTLDRLDRKYSGRPLTPPRQTSIPRDILERHERAFADENIGAARRRAEKHITEDTLFDSRGGRVTSNALELLKNDIREETASKLKHALASKKTSLINDFELESTVNCINSRRLLERSDKLLNSVGITDKSSRRAIEDVDLKRGSVRVKYENDDESKELTRWTALNDRDEDSTAATRARQTRARLNDLEEEMEALNERQAARERRAAHLRALVAENAEDTEAAQTSLKKVTISTRQEQKSVQF